MPTYRVVATVSIDVQETITDAEDEADAKRRASEMIKETTFTGFDVFDVTFVECTEVDDEE